MEQFKIENFAKNHDANVFPRYDTLTDDECARVLHSISIKYRLDDENKADIVKSIDERQTLIKESNANDPSFNLLNILQAQKIRPQPQVFINWCQYDQIDKIQLEDMVKYFSDIWYPASDDIDIFDYTFDWILSIDHGGILKLVKST